ncbi:hypothetical protein CPC08DRAFT_808315, partial [Agrocybe pediades]
DLYAATTWIYTRSTESSLPTQQVPVWVKAVIMMGYRVKHLERSCLNLGLRRLTVTCHSISMTEMISKSLCLCLWMILLLLQSQRMLLIILLWTLGNTSSCGI